jgi:hypothetical protein
MALDKRIEKQVFFYNVNFNTNMQASTRIACFLSTMEL